MKPRWPLGRGNEDRSVSHTVLLGAWAAGVLCLLVLFPFLEPRPPYTAAEIRLGAFALFLLVGLLWPVLALFRRNQLRMLLPTPASPSQIFDGLAPSRTKAYWALPYAFAVLGAAHRDSFPWVLAPMFLDAMFLRALQPLLLYAAVRWRAVLVPYGYILSWLGAAGIMAMPYWHASHMVLASPSRAQRWGALAGGLVFWVLGWLVRWASVRAARDRYRREDLVDLAFGVERPAASRTRKMTVELVGVGRRRRRMLFLVQEATGLCRPSDWVKAVALWLATFVAALLVLGRRGGSAAHVQVTGATCLVVLTWLALRSIRVSAFSGQARDRASLGWPVGYLELWGTRIALLGLMLLFTGVPAAAFVGVMAWQGPSSPGRFLWVCAANLFQMWLLAVTLASGLRGLMLAEPRPSVSRALWRLDLMAALWASYMLLVVMSIPLTSLGAGSWHPQLARAGWAVTLLWENTFHPCRAALPPLPLWPYRLAAWALTVSVAAWLVIPSVGWAARRAHARYRDPVPRRQGAPVVFAIGTN